MGGTACAGIAGVLLSDWSTLEVKADQWKAILYLGFAASGIGFFLWNKGASKSNPGTLAAFNNAVVPLAVLCSLFVFGESQSIDMENGIRLALGSALILGALVVSQRTKN